MFCGFCAFAWILPAQAGPGGAAGGALEARLGFDGLVKVGVPLPLDVVLPPLPLTGQAELLVDAPALGPDVGPIVTSTSVSFWAVPGAGRLFHIPVIINDPRRPLIVRVRIHDREALRTSVSLTPQQVGDRIVVAVSDEPFGVAAFQHLPRRVAVARLSGQSLPRRWQEYAAVDLLVVRDLDAGAVDDTQRDALLTWLRLGGHMLLIVRPGSPLPPFLDPVLPAVLGAGHTVTSLAPLATRYGGVLSRGVYAMTGLVPRPGTRRTLIEDVPVIVSGAAGDGQVTMWAFDPWQVPFLEWDGRPRLWEEALGAAPLPQIDPAALGERLPAGTSLDPVVHAEVGGAILLYVAGLLALVRRRPTLRGAAGSLLIVLVGTGAFAALAGLARDRSTSLTQAIVLEAIPGTGLGRATAVAAIAVPYGGHFRVSVSREMVASPLTPRSDLRVAIGRPGTVLAGVVRPGAAAEVLQAIGAIPIAASGWLTADGRGLEVDLGSARARQVQLRWRDRIYPVGDLPAGRSVRTLDPGAWAVAADARTSSELGERVRDEIFQAHSGDAILGNTTPVLVGELDGAAPVFTLAGIGAPGPRMTILLVPLGRR